MDDPSRLGAGGIPRGRVGPLTPVEVTTESVGELMARYDRLKHIKARHESKLAAVMDLIRDAEESGRTTVLIENLRRCIGER